MKSNRVIGMYPFLLIALVMYFNTGCKSKDSSSQPGNSSISVNAVPLPSWNDTDHKKAIISFVEKVTTEGSADFVPVAERIATFDNDGTLWSEQPMYFQFFFTFDRIKAMAHLHPEWKNKQPFKDAIDGNYKAVIESGADAINELVMAVSQDYTSEEFAQIVKDWLATAKHPTTGKLYTEMVFQPMVELLEYLRANGFKTYIVSGGSVEFMRPFTEKAYGIPPEQVIGTSFKLKFEMRDGKAVFFQIPAVNFVDDNAGKPVGIYQYIGRRPLASFGNSDGDLEMLQYTTSGNGLRFGALVHHTDAEREWAYDRKSPFGHLDKALNEANKKGWTLIDMKNDWKLVYAFEKK